ncbi:hypothetical protein [Halocalculus aciditolerans]|uniref:Uncharacterized protein n=1 Tax=Halocalculus aciditolerans TaxID=1383812 RepID=A0A830F0G4_9EURY|nr:hypothetical protein [Halocalculus aciditolerans]GGL50584.1 hypothetical protein GCM10009039_05990 [Halocalculus aciditolerans]
MKRRLRRVAGALAAGAITNALALLVLVPFLPSPYPAAIAFTLGSPVGALATQRARVRQYVTTHSHARLSIDAAAALVASALGAIALTAGFASAPVVGIDPISLWCVTTMAGALGVYLLWYRAPRRPLEPI